MSVFDPNLPRPFDPLRTLAEEGWGLPERADKSSSDSHNSLLANGSALRRARCTSNPIAIIGVQSAADVQIVGQSDRQRREIEGLPHPWVVKWHSPRESSQTDGNNIGYARLR